MKIVAICLLVFLLSACVKERIVLKDCCPEFEMDEKSLQGVTTPDQIDKERYLWKAAYYKCFCG